jgi:serine O-acetyltransferase
MFLKQLKEEYLLIKERDPSIHTYWEVMLYPCIRALRSYRRAHKLYLKGHYFWARWISQRAARKTGIEIHPGAVIGENLFIDHGAGVVIGETTIIGKNVTIYQGVTLGGTGKEEGKRHPTIKDNVMISAGAKILGSFTVGEHSKIGAGSVVISEVPPHCTVVGVPGRVVKQSELEITSQEMDHDNLPDPVADWFMCLKMENSLLYDIVMKAEEDRKNREEKENNKDDKNSQHNESEQGRTDSLGAGED